MSETRRKSETCVSLKPLWEGDASDIRKDSIFTPNIQPPTTQGMLREAGKRRLGGILRSERPSSADQLPENLLDVEFTGKFRFHTTRANKTGRMVNPVVLP